MILRDPAGIGTTPPPPEAGSGSKRRERTGTKEQPGCAVPRLTLLLRGSSGYI